MNNTLSLSDMELQIVLATLLALQARINARCDGADVGRRAIDATIENITRQVRPAFASPL